MKHDLRLIEEKLLGLRDREFESQIEQGRVLKLAKAHFTNEGLWVQWYAVDKKLFAERQGQYMVSVSEFWDSLTDDQRDVLPRAWSKIRELSALSKAQLVQFLRAYDPIAMTRDQIHVAVAAIIASKGKVTRQLDFFTTLRMPALDKFVEAARDPAVSVHAETAADYGIVCFDLAHRNADKLTEEQRMHYARQLFNMARSFSKGDLNALLQEPEQAQP